MRRAPAVVLVFVLPFTNAMGQEGESVPSVVVLGQGQVRQVQNLSRIDLAQALPGTSPIKVLEKLPGVSFQSADSLGSYEWSTRLSIRGFSQGQLGFTLDGIPLGNMSYGNNNGLHISRAISPENLGRVDVAQGVGSAATASTNNLGGTVQFWSLDPSEERSLRFALTAGSAQSLRSFARVESGTMGQWRAWASVARQRANKWKGEGPQDHDQFNAKAVAEFGAWRSTLFLSASNRSETDYQDMSPDMLRRLGWDWDNYRPDWQRAVDAAHGIFTGGVNNLDDAYYDARGLRKDQLAAFTVSHANGSVTAYHHANDGQGHWYTPYLATSATMPISIRTTEYTVARSGIFGQAEGRAGMHQLAAGLWLERSGHGLTRNYYAVSGPDDSNHFLENPFLTGFHQYFDTETTQFHVQDKVALLDGRLTVEAATRWSRVRTVATSMNAARAAGTLEASKPFLPQLGVVFAAAPGDELFATAARSYRAFEPGVYGQFSQSQAAFDANAANLRPETAATIDMGYRFRHAGMSGSLAMYRTQFSDRLLSVATCAGVVGCPNTIVNVGSVAMRGIEGALVWKLDPHWTWFHSFGLNDAHYRSDYMDKGVLVPVSGKQVVDVPRRMASTELAWEAKPWSARLSAKFTDKRYYSYLNDAAVSSFALVNASLGWSVGRTQVQLHVDNLLNRRYFSTVGSNQFVASDAAGTFPTLLVGAPRQVFLTVTCAIGP